MKTFGVLLASLSFISCSEKSATTEQAANFQSPVTAAEVLDLLGGFSKEFRTPADIENNDHAGLVLRDHEGNIDRMTTQTGWKPNTVYKVVAYRPNEGEFVCRIYSDDSSSSGFSTTNFPKGIIGSSIGTSIAEPGDTLISFTRNTSNTFSVAEEGEFDLLFNVVKKK